MTRERAAFHNLDPETFILQLKGAPLSVLMVLWWFGGMGREDLVARTGYSINTIKKALTRLEGDGLVMREHYRRWIVAPAFYQLPIPFGQLPTQPERALPDFAADEAVDKSAERSIVDLSELSTGSAPDAERSLSDLSADEAVDNLAAPEAERSTIDLSALAVTNSETPERSTSDLSAVIHSPERSTSDLSAPHVHVNVYVQEDHGELEERLQTLRPPFRKGDYWLRQVDRALVAAWLDYFDSLPAHQRKQQFTNESAYLNRVVMAGYEPPPVEARAGPCPTCGRSYVDEDGRCLVCAGKIHI